MTVPAHHDRTPSRRGQLCLRTDANQELVIRKAAELQGLTVSEYLLCAVLDRAERDLYTEAAERDWQEVYPTSAEPLTTLMAVFGDR
ncbi:MAG: DUF1778 domain-containing protein [Streptosporangiaceae bacterium]